MLYCIVMYSKLFLIFLLAFLASIPHRTILAQNDDTIKLGGLIKNSGWSLLKDQEILDNDKKVTMSELIKTFDDEMNSENSNEHLIRHLAIMLSCKQSEFIRKYVILVLSTINVCNEQNDREEYITCFKSLLENIQNIDITVTRMLNILTYFYKLSPTTTEFKQLYNALMTLKLYSEYKSSTPSNINNILKLVSTEAEISLIKSVVDLQFLNIQRIFFSINLQVQTFAVMYCLPATQPLNQNDIDDQYREHIRMLLHTKENEKFHPNENYSEPLSNIVKKFNEECFVALGFENLELDNINTMNIDLQRIWKLLEEQLPIDNIIRIHWLGEPKNVTTLVKDVTFGYSTKKLAAFQKSSLRLIAKMFYKHLIVTVQATLSDIKNRKDIQFHPSINWVELKNELIKFLSEDWPIEITETLKTLISYLELEHNVDPIEVVKLLKLEMKTASFDFVDNEETHREIDSVKLIGIFRKFTDDVVILKKSINNVRLNNVLLLNASAFEETELLMPSKESDDVASQTLCKLSTKIIAFFNVLKKYLGMCINYLQQSIGVIFLFKRFDFMNKILNERILSIVHFMLLHMLKIPKAENVNLRNAIVLMFMFDTNLINPTDENINAVIWRTSQLENLTLLIINQIDYYVVKSCGVDKYKEKIIEDTFIIDSGSCPRITTGQTYHDIDDIIGKMKDIPLIDKKCKIDKSLGYFDTLVNGEKDYDNPLKYMAELKINWDGTLQSIQSIRKQVVSSISPKKFAVYQTLVQNSVTSIFLGYILNILQAANKGKVIFTDNQIDSILLTIIRFDSIVYPSSKVDSPVYIFNVFGWCFEKNKISDIKATILKDKIIQKVISYGINLTDYNRVLEKIHIIRNQKDDDDVQETYITPLEEFVDRWVAMFKQDFYCVANYMKLII